MLIFIIEYHLYDSSEKEERNVHFLKDCFEVRRNLFYISFPLSVFSILIFACFDNDHLHVLSSGIIGQRLELVKLTHTESL